MNFYCNKNETKRKERKKDENTMVRIFQYMKKEKKDKNDDNDGDEKKNSTTLQYPIQQWKQQHWKPLY